MVGKGGLYVTNEDELGGVPGIEPQTDWAAECLKELGYPNVKRTMIPGMGHSAAYEHVIETFRPYWEGKKKRSDKQD